MDDKEQMVMTKEPMGIIAAGGSLPLEVARGLRREGHPVIGAGMWDLYDPEFPSLCDEFHHVGLIQLGKWIRVMRKHGVRQATLVGKVTKVRMYDPLLIFKQLPDLRAGRVWYITTRHDKRTDTLLGAVADELKNGGLELIDTTKYIPQVMADEGVMTDCKPNSKAQADIEFGLPIVSAMGGLDIGQSIAVKDRDVIAVEAIEGTDEMIKRAGGLCRSGNWTLIKAAKPNQDKRFDVPTVGIRTIERLKENGASCLCVEAGEVILLDKEDMLKAADEAGITVIGVKVPHQDSVLLDMPGESRGD